MALYKFLNVVAVAITVMLMMGQTITTVDACRCAELSVCDAFEAADVVVHGTVLSRSGRRGRRRRSRKRNITYTVEVTTVYKGEPDISDVQEITFTTERSSAACGVTLEKGDEYLLGLYDEDDTLTANSCGLVQKWSSVSDEDKASVEISCAEFPCNIRCMAFLECQLYTTTPTQYVCAPVCYPGLCADDEVCSLQDVKCITTPCLPVPVCTPAPGP